MALQRASCDVLCLVRVMKQHGVSLERLAMEAMLYAASRIQRLTMDGLFPLLRKSARFPSTLIAVKRQILHEVHGRLNWASSSPQQVPAQWKQNKPHCKLLLSLPISLVNTTEMTQSDWQYNCAQKMAKKWPYLTS